MDQATWMKGKQWTKRSMDQCKHEWMTKDLEILKYHGIRINGLRITK